MSKTALAFSDPSAPVIGAALGVDVTDVMCGSITMVAVTAGPVVLNGTRCAGPHAAGADEQRHRGDENEQHSESLPHRSPPVLMLVTFARLRSPHGDVDGVDAAVADGGIDPPHADGQHAGVQREDILLRAGIVLVLCCPRGGPVPGCRAAGAVGRLRSA